jgi:hypothetical protein
VFQLRQRKSGVDGQEGPLRIGGHQKDLLLSASRFQPVAEDLQQRCGMIAVRNVNDPPGVRQSLQLSRLVQVAVDQDQKLRRPSVFVTLGEDVAREQRQNFVSGNFLADRRHALK